eukprot:CAMPEP_0197185298 /NCGR_PEP_ID=MMETSP1423-20130617/11648_1 /TAXON_ID=476441 /ORGANISM="Pseudo-nitzschia heimii, Strain UNC1101" /LENGTH=366 /DNA_ID=CAMNT_0042636323 /DNA_START=180 /DNA_END=1281 /DNA_ORIENTATION=+
MIPRQHSDLRCVVLTDALSGFGGGVPPVGSGAVRSGTARSRAASCCTQLVAGDASVPPSSGVAPAHPLVLLVLLSFASLSFAAVAVAALLPSAAGGVGDQGRAAEEVRQLVVGGIDEEEDDEQADADGAGEDRHPLVDGLAELVRGEAAVPEGQPEGDGRSDDGDGDKEKQDLDPQRVFALPPQKKLVQDRVGRRSREEGQEADVVGLRRPFGRLLGDLEVHRDHQSDVGEDVDNSRQVVDELHEDAGPGAFVVDLDLDVPGDRDHRDEDASAGGQRQDVRVGLVLAHNERYRIGLNGHVVDPGEIGSVNVFVDLDVLEVLVVKDHEQDEKCEHQHHGNERQKEGQKVPDTPAEGCPVAGIRGLEL